MELMLNREKMHKILENQNWHYDNGWSYRDKGWSAYITDDSLNVLILERFPEEIIVLMQPYDDINRREIFKKTLISNEKDLQEVINFANKALIDLG